MVAALSAALVLAACTSSTNPVVPSPTGTTAAAGGVSTPQVTDAPRTVAPTPTEAPTPTTAPATPSAEPPVAETDPEPFAMNLYRKGDYVAQFTFEWCVGASVQMALNMSTDGSHTTRAEQQRIWEMARDRSFSPFGGANGRGWTAALNELDIGPYKLVSLPTFEEALNRAAEAIRATDRPVGLVMWRGRHAWMMSGFESTADPAEFDDFAVTGIRVLDPLYPHGSRVWGSSPKPNSLISPKTLAKQFVLRDSTRVNIGVPPGYVLVLPTVDDA